MLKHGEDAWAGNTRMVKYFTKTRITSNTLTLEMTKVMEENCTKLLNTEGQSIGVKSIRHL